MPTSMSDEELRQQLVGLFKYIQRVKEEIAAIDRPEHEEHDIVRMSDQLDAIVEATEEATNTIMEKVEETDNVIEEIRAALPDDKKALCDQIMNNGMDIIQACSFQDITGQRVSKVAKSITYVEARVDAIINLWGRDALEQVKVTIEDDKTDDEKLLHGPQLKDEGISQDEIDKLFD